MERGGLIIPLIIFCQVESYYLGDYLVRGSSFLCTNFIGI